MAKKPTPQPPATEQAITLPKLDVKTFQITLIGDAPLICHAWSEKAKRQMLDKQMKKARPAKDAKSPEDDYQNSLYPHPLGGFGFPSIAFKGAAVDACSHVSGLTKVEARGAFHINGELVQIKGEPTPREDMVKIAMGTADIRFRGQFFPWSATFAVRHNVAVLSCEQIFHLFDVAGFAIGIGEWRPQRDGSMGLFHVARDGEA